MNGDKDGSTAGGNIIVGIGYVIGAPGIGDCVELCDQRRNHIERHHQEEFEASGDRVRGAVAGDLAE